MLQCQPHPDWKPSEINHVDHPGYSAQQLQDKLAGCEYGVLFYGGPQGKLLFQLLMRVLALHTGFLKISVNPEYNASIPTENTASNG